MISRWESEKGNGLFNYVFVQQENMRNFFLILHINLLNTYLKINGLISVERQLKVPSTVLRKWGQLVKNIGNTFIKIDIFQHFCHLSAVPKVI